MKYNQTFLKDYLATDFLIEEVLLEFFLDPQETLVRSKLMIIKNSPAEAISNELRLDGVGLELQEIKINQQKLSGDQYKVTARELIIKAVPDSFTLEIIVKIYPEKNFSCSGLYLTNGDFCTQNEPQGFRSITYFIDRPDILAKFTTVLIADKNKYPLLLSNGNLIKKEEITGNRHRVIWQDPFPKPAYLFALVGGDFDYISDIYITKSTREVELKIFAKKEYLSQCEHAMKSLKQAMSWEEEVWGLEYDLDLYQIVGINDFNFGAMENKGLNIFNNKLLLASKDSATDNDFKRIASVIAHEYFHNWTGNRVSCRDWFQLGLKEGLTTLREQLFTEDYYGYVATRIESIKFLYDNQFVEDASLLAHPIRLNSYIEVDNFYTPTVYEKSAEVARMLITIFGQEIFREILVSFLAKFDGKSTTFEDFLEVASNISKIDLTQFKLWYDQARTPLLNITDGLDEDQRYYLEVTQSNSKANKAHYIPLSFGLINPLGKQFYSDRLMISKNIERFYPNKINEKPLLSLLQNFSAPIRINYANSSADLVAIAKYSRDPISRWEAGQNLLKLAVTATYKKDDASIKIFLNHIFELFNSLMEDDEIDLSLVAHMIKLPSEIQLMEILSTVDINKLYQAISYLKREIAKKLSQQFLNCYNQNKPTEPYELDTISIAKRSIKNVALDYISCLDKLNVDVAIEQLALADNLTDRYVSLVIIANSNSSKREIILDDYYHRWKNQPNLFNKWLAINASSEREDALSRIKRLMNYPEFSLKNPNNVYALIRTFATNNLINFHAIDGSGYEFLVDKVLAIDKFNSQLAATIGASLIPARRLNLESQLRLKNELKRIADEPSLSSNLYEIVSRVFSGAGSYGSP